MFESFAEGLYLLDTKYLEKDEYAASYIIESLDEAAIIETNTNFAIPRILHTLESLQINKDNVKYVMLTHIHLDHSGGAGLLLNHLPNAKLIVHKRGKRHLISPEKLIKSVVSVYGEENYKKMYGEILPVDENRIIAVEDNYSFTVGRKEFLAFETLGHAKHHISIFEETTKTMFTGDSFGIGYPMFNFDKEQMLFPSTSPTQFNPEDAIKSIDKILHYEPLLICLTHFGIIENIESAGEQLKDWIGFLTEEGEKLYNSGLRQEDFSEALGKLIFEKFNGIIKAKRNKPLTDKERKHLKIDFKLNAQGVTQYIEKQYKNL